MSTITCSSCGMEYDGSGLQAGVQFQCTQCGSMVQVGAPAGRVPAGPRRAGPRGPARGPMRAAPMGSPQQQMQDQQYQQQGYGPPPRSGSNTGLFVGLGVGAVVLVLIVVVVVMSSSSSSPEQTAQSKTEEENKRRREDVQKKDAETAAENAAIKKPMDAALEQASAVDAAIRNEDAKTLEALFDWQIYAAYNQTLIDKDAKFLNSPLFAVGTWEQVEGRYTGTFLGKAAHGPDSLRERVMAYIKAFMFGAPELKWEREKTEADAGSFSLELGGTKYLGKIVFITYRGAGKTKELWLGAPKGSADVRLLNFKDLSAIKNLQAIEAKNERVDDRELMRPDHDPRDPRDPGEVPDTDPKKDPDANLPAAAKTGGMPTQGTLINAINELKRGSALNNARIKAIESEPSKAEKKATMGAMIDLLLDAVKSKDRTLKTNISSALWEVWQPFVYEDWTKTHMVYENDFGGGQSESDLIVRRWLEIYNNYKTE